MIIYRLVKDIMINFLYDKIYNVYAWSYLHNGRVDRVYGCDKFREGITDVIKNDIRGVRDGVNNIATRHKWDSRVRDKDRKGEWNKQNNPNWYIKKNKIYNRIYDK